MTVKIDIKRSSRLKQDRNGYRAERIAMVSGVTGDADAKLYNALNDAALPNIGDVHPEIPEITLQIIQTEPLGGGNYRVVMSYYSEVGSESGSENARFTAKATTSVEEVSRDINNNIMQTEYAAAGASVSQYFLAEIERPRMNLEFEYSATEFPQSEIDNYMGKINSVPWLGYAIETILCSAVHVEDDGSNFRVRFVFQYNKETWKFPGQVAYHFNVITAHPARPDSSLDLQRGEKLFDVYETADFTPLGFSFSGPINFKLLTGNVALTGSDATLTVA